MEYLIQKGASVTLSSIDGSTAFHLAASGGYLAICSCIAEVDSRFLFDKDLEGINLICVSFYYHSTL